LASWNIVWCSERCYKAENDERRARLSELAQTAGATLVLLKKAHKFAAWLAKAQRPPYILLTDWREAKAIVAGGSTGAGAQSASVLFGPLRRRGESIRACKTMDGRTTASS
jgi:hypothetical protein